MRRLLLLALLLVLVGLPGAASGAACSPLTCAPAATPLAGTHLLAVQPSGAASAVRVLDLADGATRWQLPAGVVAGKLLVHKEGSSIAWLNATTGRTQGTTDLPATYTTWQLAGASIDGLRAVLVRHLKHPERTSLAVVGTATQRLTLRGNWAFDALRGPRLYLLQQLTRGYVVRAYDLARNALVRKPVANGDEGTVIDGLAWSRLSSWDGRYVFTLYINGASEAMIHALDLRSGTARCIDLPGKGDFNGAAGYGLALSPDGKTLWAASAASGHAAAVDVARGNVRSSFAFNAFPSQSPTAPAIALSPRLDLLALAAEGRTLFLDLRAKKALAGPYTYSPALAIGFSPDGRKLWSVDEVWATRSVEVPRRR